MSEENSRSNSPTAEMKLQEMTIEPPPEPRIAKATKSSAKKTTRPQVSANSKKKTHSLERELKLINQKGDHTSNFMADFDPSKSRREKTRNAKKVDYRESEKQKSKGTIFNDKGIHKDSGLDSCDCLKDDCPGCHFPCTKCKSTKCGFECRQNRKWQVEFVINEDNSMEKRINPYATQTMKK